MYLKLQDSKFNSLKEDLKKIKAQNLSGDEGEQTLISGFVKSLKNVSKKSVNNPKSKVNIPKIQIPIDSPDTS